MIEMMAREAVFTSHGTVLVARDGRLLHVPLDESSCEAATAFVAMLGGPIEFENARGAIEAVTTWHGDTVLLGDGFYGCAEPNRPDLVFDRTVKALWESFTLRNFTPAEMSAAPPLGASTAELSRFISGGTAVLDARILDERSLTEPQRDYEVASPTFDRIVVSATPSFEETRARIAQAMCLLAPDGLLLVDGCNGEEIARAIVASACERAIEPIVAPGLRQSPRYQIARRGADGNEPTSRRVILVAVFGERSRLEWMVSHPTIARYAERIGAELVLVEGDLDAFERPLAKMHALERLESSCRVLLLDTDVIVRANAPDLFSIVPEDAVGAFIEGFACDRSQALRDTIANFGVSPAGPYYANTGVLLLPQDMAARLRVSSIDRVMYIDEMYEQNYFNAVFHELGYGVFNISALFNCMPGVTPSLLSSAFFVHFAGGSTQSQQLIVWEETFGLGGHALRIKTHLTPKDVRVFDMRNERAAEGRSFDRLWQATLLRSDTGTLLRRESRIRCEYPATEGRIITCCDLGELRAGDYEIEILLDPSSLDRALGTCDDRGVVDSPPSTCVRFDVVSTRDEELTVLETAVPVERGAATASFVLPSARSVGCRIYGRDSPLAVYGIRVRTR